MVSLKRLRSTVAATLGSERVRLVAFAVLFCSVFKPVYKFVDRKAHLDPEAYFEGALSFQFLSEPRTLAIVGCYVALALVFGSKLQWKGLSGGFPLRALMMGVAAPLVWHLFTLDYNYFTDQSYIVDRLLLLTAYGLIWRHPVFVPIFLLLSVNYIYQLRIPLPSFTTTDKKTIYLILVAFGIFLPLCRLIPRHRGHVFCFIALSLIGMSYATP